MIADAESLLEACRHIETLEKLEELLFMFVHPHTDPALAFMGQIIHGADIPMDEDVTSESAGLRAIAFEFMYKYGKYDHQKIAAQLDMHDAFYLYRKKRVGVDPAYSAIQ